MLMWIHIAVHFRALSDARLSIVQRIRIRRICCLHLCRSYGSVVVVGRPIWNNRTNVRVAIGRAVQQHHPHTHFLLPSGYRRGRISPVGSFKPSMLTLFAIGAGQLIAAGLRAGDSFEIGRFVEKETQMSKGDAKVFTSRFLHYTDTKVSSLLASDQMRDFIGFQG
ncbi:hypothetical protein EDC04DRAFT_1592718 [Pisolithus marmoratus]|nr:hypothetical protein EDC04DRAFT_1592718 [Pisolithus marmoratus]